MCLCRWQSDRYKNHVWAVMKNEVIRRVLKYYVRIPSRPQRIWSRIKQSKRGDGWTMGYPNAAIKLRHRQILPRMSKHMSICPHTMWIVSGFVGFWFVLAQRAGTPLQDNSIISALATPSPVRLATSIKWHYCLRLSSYEYRQIKSNWGTRHLSYLSVGLDFSDTRGFH